MVHSWQVSEAFRSAEHIACRTRSMNKLLLALAAQKQLPPPRERHILVVIDVLHVQQYRARGRRILVHAGTSNRHCTSWAVVFAGGQVLGRRSTACPPAPPATELPAGLATCSVRRSGA